MSPHHRVGAVRKVTGGPGYCLVGHRHAFSLDNEVVCTDLPRKPDDSLYKVILVCCYTKEELAALLYYQLVNPLHLHEILKIYHDFENKYSQISR